MNLVTVCNNAEFMAAAKRLIDSFWDYYPDGQVVLCVFGEMTCTARRISDKMDVVAVPNDCDHAHNPRFYYYKTAGLKIAMDRFDGPFIWLDSRDKLVSRLYEVEETLERETRFFVQFPHIEDFRLKYWITKACLAALGMTYPEIENVFTYWAAIQAYVPTEENRRFVDMMLAYMKNPQVAGPSNWVQQPDGPTGVCRAHRNEQSMLSALLLKLGYEQQYSRSISERYSDCQTLRNYKCDADHDWSRLRILSRLP